MQPLNLRDRPPREPRARLAGLVLLPRTIDKARAALPGGDPGTYFITPGLSAWLLSRLKLSEAEFVELVRDCAGEDELAAALADRIPPERCERLNAAMENLRVSQIAPEMQADFLRLYGPQDHDPLIFDVLLADDRAMFGPIGALKTS